MRSSKYLLPWVITRSLACLSIGLTVACQSQPSSVDNPISPTPPVSKSIPASPTVQPTPATQPSPANTVARKSPVPSPPKPQKANKTKGTNIYQNQQLGIKFEYPPGYTVDAPKGQKLVTVWRTQDYQAIKAGKFDNSAPPGYLNISVEPNPQKLPPEEWVKGNSEFLSPENFANKAIAGKQAVAFRSSGLFDFEHLVIPTESGNGMIVISMAEGDQKYQKVLEKVTSSLQLTK